jgi:hypothetical protein
MCSVASRGGVDEVELGSSGGSHNNIEDTELSGSQRSNHEPSGGESDSAEFVGTFFGSDLSETGEHTTFTTSSLFVDLGEEGIGGVRDGGGDNTSNNTGLEGNDDVLSLGEFIWGSTSGSVDNFSSFSLDGELGHGVRNLFAEDGDESRVESSHESHLSVHFLGAIEHTVGVFGVRYKSDSAGFEGAEEAIGNGFSDSGRHEVDLLSVVPGSLFSVLASESDFEVFDSTELEPSLDEVSLGSRAETSEETTSTFSSHDLSCDSEHTTLVLDGVELDLGLDDINGDNTTVSSRAANGTGKGTLEVVAESEGTLSHEFIVRHKIY